MTKLQRLYAEHAQSPWLDNITRRHPPGILAHLVDEGIRGVTANPTIFSKAIQASGDYDQQFASLMAEGASVEDAFWELVISDVIAALTVLRPIYDASGGQDGFVSLEVGPELARDILGTIVAARRLHERIAQPNLLVKIPATPEGIPAIEAMIAEGRSINVTLVFSLTRYEQVVEAYLSGLEALVAKGGDPAGVRSVASFFVSRVDTEVDDRLQAIGTPDALALRGKAGVAQAKLAYRLFRQRFSGRRWEHLAGLGGQLQRPLWASTSTKNPAYPDTLYVDSLIGPDTINTLTEATIAAFEDHGSPERTVDVDVGEAAEVMRRLADVGIDMDDVGLALEDRGVAAFLDSVREVRVALDAKAHSLSRH